MCLNIIEGPLLATKDIICYKHFNIKEVRGKKRYVSPYMNVLWPEKGLTARLVMVGDNVENGLHAFLHKKDAIGDQYAEGSDKVVKMIIPKGSKYYKGYFFGKHSLASNKMKFYEVGNN